jgi:hypothetical protein
LNISFPSAAALKLPLKEFFKGFEYLGAAQLLLYACVMGLSQLSIKTSIKNELLFFIALKFKLHPITLRGFTFKNNDKYHT